MTNLPQPGFADPQSQDDDVLENEDLQDTDDDEDGEDDADVATDENGNETLKRGGLELDGPTTHPPKGKARRSEDIEAQSDVDSDRDSLQVNSDPRDYVDSSPQSSLNIYDIERIEDDAKGG